MAASPVIPAPPVDDIYRAWREAGVNPDLAHAAVEQVRDQAGRNVVVVMGSRFDELGAKIDAQGARLEAKIDAQGAHLEAKIDAQGARLEAKIDAQSARLDDKIDAQSARLDGKIDAQGAHLEAKIDAQGARLEAKIDAQSARIEVLQRVIRPLIGILATAVFGLLYEAVSQ